MNPASPPPVFEVIFEGAGLFPEGIPLRTLSDSLAAIQRLAAGDGSQVGEDEDEEEVEKDLDAEPKDESLRLVGVERGSARYLVAGPPPAPALRRLRQVGRLLIDPGDGDAQVDYILAPVERLSNIAKRLDCTITLMEPGLNGGVLARIEPVSYEAISKTLLVQGPTTITGKVVRVGGATALRCGLRVPFQQRLLICKVENAQIARKIGDRLYEDVVVFGDATWLKNSWRLYAFKIKGLVQAEQGSIIEALEQLREAGGKAWDSVEDPSSFLDEVNSDQ